jgi:hypothetical protein
MEPRMLPVRDLKRNVKLGSGYTLLLPCQNQFLHRTALQLKGGTSKYEGFLTIAVL